MIIEFDLSGNYKYLRINAMTEDEYKLLLKAFGKSNINIMSSGFKKDFYFFRLEKNSVKDDILRVVKSTFSYRLVDEYFELLLDVKQLRNISKDQELRYDALKRKAVVWKSQLESHQINKVELEITKSAFDSKILVLKTVLKKARNERSKGEIKIRLQAKKLIEFNALVTENSLNKTRILKLQSKENKTISIVNDFEKQLRLEKRRNSSLKGHVTRLKNKISTAEPLNSKTELQEANLLGLKHDLKAQKTLYESELKALQEFQQTSLETVKNEVQNECKLIFDEEISTIISSLEKEYELQFDDMISQALNKNIILESKIDEMTINLQNSTDSLLFYKQSLESIESSHPEMMEMEFSSNCLNEFPFFSSINFLAPSDDIVLKEMDKPDKLLKHLIVLNDLNGRQQIRGKKVHKADEWKEYVFAKDAKFKINSRTAGSPDGRMYYRYGNEHTDVMISSKKNQTSDIHHMHILSKEKQ